MESESVLNRITYLLKMDDGSVFELLSDDLVRQLVPGTDAQSRLIRHNLRDILGYIDITGAVSKEDISKLKTLLSILKEFSGRLDFEDGHSLMNVLQNSRFSKLLYFRFNTPENIDVEKRLSQELASFLFNLMSVFESNLIDLLKGDYVKNGYLRMDAYYIVPFLLIINDQLVIGFANNGGNIDSAVFSNLGKMGTSSKGKGRGTGLASCAQIAKDMGMGLSVMQFSRGEVYYHDLVTQENLSTDYYTPFKRPELEEIREEIYTHIPQFCQQKGYDGIPNLAFAVSIPIGKVYKQA